ncbi:MAG: hypothetical protein ACI4CE_07530 [Methanomethylophilus alvi]
MGEARRRREEAEAAFARTGIWTVTRGAEEIRREVMAEAERFAKMVKGLARCPVCGREAKAVVFGAGGLGVWVGCDRSIECSKYIAIHTEGWSLEEVAAEWNRYNSGVFRSIRRAKRWFHLHFGAEKRVERKEKLKKEAKVGEEKAKREQVFGIKSVSKRGEWWRIWRKGNK